VLPQIDWTAGPRVGAVIPVGAVKPELAPWSSLELTGALLRLSAHGFYAPVQSLFAEAVSSCPQLLLAALLQMAPAGSASETHLQAEMLEQLLPAFIASDAHLATLKHAWEQQPAAVMRGMVQLHAAQPQSLLRLLDLAQSFSALDEILGLKPCVPRSSPPRGFWVAPSRSLLGHDPSASGWPSLARCWLLDPA
jgi:hypothetical protein